MLFSKRGLIVVLCFLCFVCGFAQQDAQSLMFVYDPLLYNGAAASVKDEVSCNLHIDKQWVNLEGSPLTVFLTTSTPLFNTGLALGASYIHQSIGVNEWSDVEALFAYRLSLSKSYALSMSVGGTYLWHDFNDAKLANSDGDPTMEMLSDDCSSFSGQVGFWLDAPFGHLSLSAKSIPLGDDSPYKTVPHGYLSLSKDFHIDKHYTFKMDMIAMGTENAPLSFFLAPNLDCEDRWDFGLLYEIDHYVGALFRVLVCEHFYLGGAYSYALNGLSKVGASSSFELMIGCRFSTIEERMAW